MDTRHYLQHKDTIFTDQVFDKFQKMVEHETLSVTEEFLRENEPKIREMIRDRVRKNAIEMSLRLCKMMEFELDRNKLTIRIEDKTT